PRHLGSRRAARHRARRAEPDPRRQDPLRAGAPVGRGRRHDRRPLLGWPGLPPAVGHGGCRRPRRARRRRRGASRWHDPGHRARRSRHRAARLTRRRRAGVADPVACGRTLPLADGFGRVHRDLRISVTDRCNFRCTYCMPSEGMEWLPRDELLTFEEIERIARLLVERYGFDSIRLTGGEPTVRAKLPVLVEKLAALGTALALTTNGATLTSLAPQLVDAGLNRINISLDTRRPDRFHQITRRDDLDRVLAGIDAAL